MCPISLRNRCVNEFTRKPRKTIFASIAATSTVFVFSFHIFSSFPLLLFVSSGIKNYYLITTKGVVKKCGLLKILHDKFKSGKKNEPVIKEYVESFSLAKEFNKEIEPLISKSHEILNPLRVLTLFKNIPEEVWSNILYQTLLLNFFYIPILITCFKGHSVASNQLGALTPKRSNTHSCSRASPLYSTLGSKWLQSWHVCVMFLINIFLRARNFFKCFNNLMYWCFYFDLAAPKMTSRSSLPKSSSSITRFSSTKCKTHAFKWSSKIGIFYNSSALSTSTVSSAAYLWACR